MEPKINRIEFIGVSGVGKTTVFQALFHRRKRRQWCTKDELLVRNALKIKHKELELHLYKLLLRTNISIDIKSRISKYLISKYSGIDLDCEFSKYNNLLRVFMRCTWNNTDIESFRKFILIKSYADLICFYYIYNHIFPFPCTVLFEEGIVRKSIDVYSEEYIDDIIHNDMNISNVLLPKAVICCEADLSVILNRRKKRIEEGKGTITERKMKDDELTQNTLKCLEKYHRQKDYLLKNRVQYLELDLTDDPLENSANRINRFLDQIG